MAAASAGSLQPATASVVAASVGIMASGAPIVETHHHQLQHQHHQYEPQQRNQLHHNTVVYQNSTAGQQAVMLQHHNSQIQHQAHQQQLMPQNCPSQQLNPLQHQNVQYHFQQNSPVHIQQHQQQQRLNLNHQHLQHQQQQHQTFIPRVGQLAQSIQLVSGGGNINGGATGRTNVNIRQLANLNSIDNQKQSYVTTLTKNNLHQQQQNISTLPPPSQAIPKQQIASTLSANLAPGWRRKIVNNEVIYISPTGTTLRNLEQITDYLLSSGTCKCGLPCPLRPEYFFDFNTQVPTTLLKMPLENGQPSRSVTCLHQKRFYESHQQNLVQKDIKRRKLGNISGGKVLTALQQQIPQCSSVSVYSAGNIMQTIKIVGNGASNGKVLQKQQTQSQAHLANKNSSNIVVTNQEYEAKSSVEPQQLQMDSIAPECEKQIGNVTLSKTPPWRKSKIEQQPQHHITKPVEDPNRFSNDSNERVPPLPQAHMVQQTEETNLPPPWQDQTHQNRFLKSRTISMQVVKKPPNFKDDPEGYLNAQTAILHNSIMNVVKSPDIDDSNMEVNVKSPIVKSETHSTPISVIQQQQQQNQSSFTNNSVDIKQTNKNPNRIYINGQTFTNSQTNGAKQQLLQQTPIQTQPQSQPQNQLRNYSQSQSQSPHQSAVQQLAHQNGNFIQFTPQKTQQQQRMTAPNQLHASLFATQQQHSSNNVLPTNNIEKRPNAVSITSIGGQTVTHFPNGMVQIEQNCDNANGSTALKPQQQIQLQQQIQQHNILFRQNQQIQKIVGNNKATNDYNNQSSTSSMSVGSKEIVIPTAQESPVSSSTPETPNSDMMSKGPAQVGAISTSNESPNTCPSSPAESVESSGSSRASVKTVLSPNPRIVHSPQIVRNTMQRMYSTLQTQGRNTITSVTAGRANTATTAANNLERTTLTIEPANRIIHQTQKLSPNSAIPVSGLQLQPIIQREPGSQLIMTSNGQIIVMPAGSNQVIKNNTSNQQQNLLDVMNMQNSAASAGHAQVQSPNSFIMSSGNNGGTTVILNNGQNLIATGNGTKVLTNGGNIISGQNIITNNQVINNGGLISPSNNGILGQQTVVLNTMPNSYVIQPNYTTTVEGQVVGQIVNQDNGTTTFIQQTQQQTQQQSQRHIILTSPDVTKRKAKKRKSSSSSSSSSTTQSSLSPQQSPNTIQQSNTALANLSTQQSAQTAQVVQITTQPQYQSQGFQLSPGIQGIVMNKNPNQTTAPQQQILFQNGQIIQPMNLIGQQLLVPAGFSMMAPDTTLLQIQNVGTCGSILTPQGMVLRAQSPQNKNFLSPNNPGQQYIVGSNGQLSPINQIYSTPMGLMMPQHANNSATFVQQNATIIQQQPQIQQHNTNPSITVLNTNTSDHFNDCNSNRTSVSPPDTTTHSPRSPERPLSQRSGGSDMVQCVSSSEPDAVVSPQIADSQSPNATDCDRGISYQTTNVYKPSEAKIRRVETPPQFGMSTQDLMVKPDSHESPRNCSPTSVSSIITTTATSPRSTKYGLNNSSNINNNNNNNNNNKSNKIKGSKIQSNGNYNGVIVHHQLSSFSIGELVWGAARGHPAWPGKIVVPPDGICPPSDSTWVQWFGGKVNIELVAVATLKTLSEGLDAHHRALKDTRKSRKLNSQLERAIHEAMTELDRISSSNQPTSSTSGNNLNSSKQKHRGRNISQPLGQQRTKPIRIAPAPPNVNINNNNILLQKQQPMLQTNYSHLNNQQLIQVQQQQHPHHASNN